MTDSQTAVFRQTRFSFLTRWLLPTSFDKARNSERLILKYGGINVEAQEESDEHGDSFEKRKNAHLLHVDIGNGEFINTLELDESGFEESAKDKLNVVMCHGFGAGLGFFYKNFRALMSIPNSRIFAVDWLGMGMSSRPVFNFWRPADVDGAVNFFIDSLERWRRQQKGLEKFVLVGHSLGGYLATIYALRYPERVSKLILLSPVGIPLCEDEKLTVTGRPFPSWISTLWNGSYTPQWLIRSLGPIGPRFVRGYTTSRFPYLSEEENGAFCNYLYHISAAPGSGEYSISSILAPGAWARKPLATMMRDMKVPTTFLYGDYDWMDYRHAEEAAKGVQVATKVIRVPQSGHHLYMDNSEDVNKFLLDEIKSV